MEPPSPRHVRTGTSLRHWKRKRWLSFAPFTDWHRPRLVWAEQFHQPQRPNNVSLKGLVLLPASRSRQASPWVGSLPLPLALEWQYHPSPIKILALRCDGPRKTTTDPENTLNSFAAPTYLHESGAD